VTLWNGRPIFATPLLFVIGFFVVFLIGGLTGVMLGSVPFNMQTHDTFFVTAHMHYVLLGGSVFPLFGAIYYWFPKAMGRMLSERLGKWHFWLFFIGTNVTFFPQHHLGFMGMPRRIYTYLPEMGWSTLNLVSTAGALLIGASVLVFLVNVVRTLLIGRPAGDDPWGGPTLEWATTSPPQNYNFRHLPTVASRHPLWDPHQAERPVVTGLRDDRREVLVTSLMDAAPDCRQVLPGPTPIPFIAALATSVAFVGVIYEQHWVPIGGVLMFLALVAWNWPRTEQEVEPRDGPDHEIARRAKEHES
jgi:cytochrome c oxidase subunit I+III